MLVSLNCDLSSVDSEGRTAVYSAVGMAFKLLCNPSCASIQFTCILHGLSAPTAEHYLSALIMLYMCMTLCTCGTATTCSYTCTIVHIGLALCTTASKL